MTEDPKNAFTRYFPDSFQAGLDFRYYQLPSYFSHHVVSSCMGILIENQFFTFARKEIGDESSFALLIQKKFSRASCSTSGTRVLERCGHSTENLIQLIQRGLCEQEVRCLKFFIRRPCDLICIPHLFAHGLSTLDTCSPKILSGWIDATTTKQQLGFQTLDA